MINKKQKSWNEILSSKNKWYFFQQLYLTINSVELAKQKLGHHQK